MRVQCKLVIRGSTLPTEDGNRLILSLESIEHELRPHVRATIEISHLDAGSLDEIESGLRRQFGAGCTLSLGPDHLANILDRDVITTDVAQWCAQRGWTAEQLARQAGIKWGTAKHALDGGRLQQRTRLAIARAIRQACRVDEAMRMDRLHFALALWRARRDARLTIPGLARMIGTAPHTVWQWEHADLPVPDEQRVRLRRILDFDEALDYTPAA